MSSISTIAALSLSVVSSVAIVVCNKALMSNLHFNFATTLTSAHMVVTFASLHLARVLHFFTHKPISQRVVIAFGLLNGASVGFLNLSLGFNSVGFYQMTKLAIIPFTVLLQTLFFKRKFSMAVQASLLLLLLGVGVATITDLQLNFIGCVVSILAIITTCVAQISTYTIQQSHQVSSTQLLYQSSPFMAVILIFSGPPVDQLLTSQNVFKFHFTPIVLVFILLSCFIAVSVNFSSFLVIGKTSPVTYQVLGHLKTCLVLLMGFIFFSSRLTLRNAVGIAIALAGMFLYSATQIQESKGKEASEKQHKEDAGQTNQTDVESGPTTPAKGRSRSNRR